MRVQLMANPDASREEGAVAIVVALLLTVLLGISAFAVDFGLAYSSKRQLQTGVDGAVIAAASTYADQNGSCGTLRDNGALQTVAYNRAVALVKDADPTAALALADFDVRCSPTGGVEVEATAKTTTEVGLGGVFGLDEVNMNRSATASLEVAGGVIEGLRPFLMCSLDLPPTGGAFPTEVRLIGGVTNGAAYDPGCPEPSGNWWTINCPEDIGKNGDPFLRNAIESGCKYPVEIVESPSPPPPDNDGLEYGCPPVNPPSPTIPDDCVEANPGNITVGQAKAWKDVIDNQELVILPVFCGGTNCTPDAAVIIRGGNNAEYPIYAFAAMRVCGYHFGNRMYQSFAGTCANNPAGLTVAPGESQSHYMLASFERVPVTGTVSPSGCSLGAACDGGVRQVFMTD